MYDTPHTHILYKYIFWAFVSKPDVDLWQNKLIFLHMHQSIMKALKVWTICLSFQFHLVHVSEWLAIHTHNHKHASYYIEYGAPMPNLFDCVHQNIPFAIFNVISKVSKSFIPSAFRSVLLIATRPCNWRHFLYCLYIYMCAVQMILADGSFQTSRTLTHTRTVRHNIHFNYHFLQMNDSIDSKNSIDRNIRNAQKYRKMLRHILDFVIKLFRNDYHSE